MIPAADFWETGRVVRAVRFGYARMNSIGRFLIRAFLNCWAQDAWKGEWERRPLRCVGTTLMAGVLTQTVCLWLLGTRLGVDTLFFRLGFFLIGGCAYLSEANWTSVQEDSRVLRWLNGQRGSRPLRMKPGLRHGWLWLVVVMVLVWPVSTRQGINYEVMNRRIPLGLKAAQFLYRDMVHRRLARKITAGQKSDVACVEALLSWVGKEIQPTPEGRAIIDDHVLGIVERGYGEPDQMADLFTTLCVYSGYPAFWKVIKLSDGDGERVLCFVCLQGDWTVWDASRGIGLENSQGRLLTVEQLTAETPRASFETPQLLRAEKQMPIRRLLFELGRKRF